MNELKNLTNVVKLGKLVQKQNCSHYFFYLINYSIIIVHAQVRYITIETKEIGRIGYNASPFPIFLLR